jgi:hypothetical protein
VTVRITPEAEADIEALPTTIMIRLEAILDRLERWPRVSDAKVLTREWAGTGESAPAIGGLSFESTART